MALIQSLHDLDVYRLGREQAKQVFLPKHKRAKAKEKQKGKGNSLVLHLDIDGRRCDITLGFGLEGRAFGVRRRVSPRRGELSDKLDAAERAPDRG